ncbi:hypothetical protein J4423_00755 [Candidatus Pacearchaeota archaeon]|nr:hypothetical protein [Candidatus Pacearchaeota archaeon]
MKIEKRESRKERIKRKIREEISKAYRHKRLIVGIISFLVLVTIYLFKDSPYVTLRYSTFIGLIIAFYIVDHLFDIRFKLKHYLFIIIIGTSALFLSYLYFTYPQYDKAQHFILPMLLCSIMFFMINKLNIALKWKITFTVFSVAGILGIFEIGEYILDLFFNLKLQGVYLRDLKGLEKFHLILNPLDDTMADMSFGLLGSSIYAVYAWIKYKKHK